MKNLDFEWLTDEFMLYCRSTQLREKTMSSYEQTLHLFGRWLSDELKIYTVDKITENVIRKYIDDLMTRGKYTFYVNDLSKKKNCPDRRRDYRKPVSVTTINNYIRNIRVFFNWMERESAKEKPMGFSIIFAKVVFISISCSACFTLTALLGFIILFSSNFYQVWSVLYVLIILCKSRNQSFYWH